MPFASTVSAPFLALLIATPTQHPYLISGPSFSRGNWYRKLVRSPLTARLTRRKTRVGVSRILLDQFSEISSRGNDGASSTHDHDANYRLRLSKVSRRATRFIELREKAWEMVERSDGGGGSTRSIFSPFLSLSLYGWRTIGRERRGNWNRGETGTKRFRFWDTRPRTGRR